MRIHRLRNSIQIAIVGGNGFIGRAIIHRLSSYPNLRIFSIDKKHNVNIDTKKYKAIVQQIKADVSNEGVIQSLLISYPVDVVIYAAGYEYPTDGLSMGSQDDLKALLGLYHTLAALDKMDLNQDEDRPYFMYISSWSVYGTQKTKLITEDTKEYPGNHAGMSKLLAEDLVKRLCTKAKSPFSILRPTEVYGRRHHNELKDPKYWAGYVSHYINKVVNKEESIEVFSPKAKIDVININYLSKLVVEMIRDKKEGIYNVSSGNAITMKELVNKIVESYGKGYTGRIINSSALNLEDMKIDSTKAQSIVPYDHSKYDLDAFIKDYIPLRRYEIAKGMAIEQILSEPVTLDMAALKAQEAFEKRQEKRAIEYKKIKEIAGPEFFRIKLGRIQERSQILLKDEYEKDKLEYKESDSLEKDRKALILESDAVNLLKLK